MSPEGPPFLGQETLISKPDSTDEREEKTDDAAKMLKDKIKIAERLERNMAVRQYGIPEIDDPVEEVKNEILASGLSPTEYLAQQRERLAELEPPEVEEPNLEEEAFKQLLAEERAARYLADVAISGGRSVGMIGVNLQTLAKVQQQMQERGVSPQEFATQMRERVLSAREAMQEKEHTTEEIQPETTAHAPLERHQESVNSIEPDEKEPDPLQAEKDMLELVDKVVKAGGNRGAVGFHSKREWQADAAMSKVMAEKGLSPDEAGYRELSRQLRVEILQQEDPAKLLEFQIDYANKMIRQRKSGSPEVLFGADILVAKDVEEAVKKDPQYHGSYEAYSVLQTRRKAKYEQ